MTETYKKFELMLTRRAKAYSSSCSQTVSLSPAISSQFILGVRCFYFESLRSFTVIDVDTTEKLTTSACWAACPYAYLQPPSRKTGQER